MSATTLFRNARVLTMDEAGTIHDRADVLIEGDLIASVAPSGSIDPATQRADREIDASGHLVMPGLINGHFHSPVNLYKGVLPSLPLEIFMLYESPNLEAVTVAPREAYVRTMLGALEMLRFGTTSVQDDAFFVPDVSPPLIDAMFQAYADSGIRATVGLDLPDVPELDKLPYLAELLPSNLRDALTAQVPMTSAEGLDHYAYLLEQWHGREDGRLRAAVSCSAPHRVTPDHFAALDELSRRFDLPFFAHVLETKLQRVFGLERLGGRSLVSYVSDLGLLSDRLNIIHGIWTDDEDMDLIAASGAVVAHNPGSNLRLGSGIMPFRRLRDRGIPICLGTDEAIADDSVNMWLVAKLTGLIHNLTDPDYERWPTAAEILQSMFQGGAQAMRQPHRIGRIVPGYQADLIMLDLDSPAFTPLNDLMRQLVYCELGSSVRLTMVAGRVVYEDGRSTLVDEVAIRAEARELAMRSAQDRTESDRWAADLKPYYREMYLRAAARPVGLSRRLGADGEKAQ